MRYVLLKNVQAKISVYENKVNIHINDVDAPIWENGNDWMKYVCELNRRAHSLARANKHVNQVEDNLALEMNGGKTIHVDSVDIWLTITNPEKFSIHDGVGKVDLAIAKSPEIGYRILDLFVNDSYLISGDLEVSDEITYDDATIEIKEIDKDYKPAIEDERDEDDDLDSDEYYRKLGAEASEDDEEYTEEFFESVYRESRDPSTKDRFNNIIEKIKSKISNELEYSDESNKIFIKDNETWYDFEVNFGRGRIYLTSPNAKSDQAAFDSDDEAADIIISMFKGKTYAKDSGIIKGTDGEAIDKLGNVVRKEIYSVIDEIKKKGKVNKVEVITMEEFKRQNPGNVYLISEYLDWKGNVKYGTKNVEWSFSKWLPDDYNEDVVKVDVTHAPTVYFNQSYDWTYYLYWSGDPVTGSTDGVYGIQHYTYDEILGDLLNEPDGEKEFIALANRIIDR